ncbi:hypothetical protein MBAV_002872 [Candidatus Magnetobacterium bavaricum]|uniref:DUF3782 domain-containing protein n=1 Tax=Candidatus Magnetobacterium bavaricum TaxID=29290 RepID=A0A0F3GSM4_9BACT|nr:hypothetical protein MBAV_002872 [Candidatus Magnetobacterium bavaricum]
MTMYATEDRLDRLEAIVEQLARQAAEDTRQLKEAMRISSEKVDAQLAKTDAQLARTDAQLAETDAQLARTHDNLATVEAILKESGKQLAKTEKLVAKTTEAVNKLTGKWSNFVVGLVFPATKKMFKKRGIELKKVYRGIQSDVEAARIEIDILGINGQYVVAIEIKSTLSVADVNEHLERLSRFKEAFDEYAGRIVIGAVAGIVIEEGVDRYAYHKGLFVIGESGNTVRILNDGKFVPRHF